MFRGNCQSGFRITSPLDKAPCASKSLAGLWAKLPCVEKGFRTIDYLHEVPEEETAFALWFDSDGLVVLIRAEITATGSVRPGAKKAEAGDIAANDSLEIEIDTAHNHSDYLWFQFDSNETRIASRRTSLQFTLRCDRIQKDQAIKTDEWSLTCETAKDAWYSRVHIPFRLLGLKSARELVTWGFNIIQRRYVGPKLVESSWSPVPSETQSPWDFGEVIASSATARISSLDFGEVYHDWNELDFSVENLTGKPGKVKAEFHAWCQNHDFRQALEIPLDPGKSNATRIRFELDSREWRRQDIEVTLYEGERATYVARFSAGHNSRHGGACIVLKHGARWFEDSPPEDPVPSDPDFPVRKRRYILSRLPDFPEMGWWGGPQNDWILRDRRGSGLEFNLLSDRILEELGDMIARLFDSDEDRVIATTMLTHRLLIYSPVGCFVQASLSPLGSLRHGAAICSGFTCVQHAVLSGTPRTDGKRGYRSWWTNVYDHTILTVELPDYCTMVDPSLGGFHYTENRARLATAAELLNNPKLSEGTLLGRERDYGGEASRDLGWYGSLAFPPMYLNLKPRNI